MKNRICIFLFICLTLTQTACNKGNTPPPSKPASHLHTPEPFPSLQHFEYSSDTLDYMLTVYKRPDGSLNVYATARKNDLPQFIYSGKALQSEIDSQNTLLSKMMVKITGHYVISRQTSSFTITIGKTATGASVATALCTDTSASLELSSPGLLRELRVPEPDSIAIANGSVFSLQLGLDSSIGMPLYSNSCDTIRSSHGALISILRTANNELLEKRCFSQAGEFIFCPYDNYYSGQSSDNCTGVALFFDNEITTDTASQLLIASYTPILPVLPDGSYLYSMAFFDTVINCYTESNLNRITVDKGKWTVTEVPKTTHHSRPAAGIYREQWSRDGELYVEDDCRCENLAIIINGDDLQLGSYCDIPDGENEETLDQFKITHLYTRPDNVTVFNFGDYCAEYKYNPDKELRILLDGVIKTFIHIENPGFSKDTMDCDEYQG